MSEEKKQQNMPVQKGGAHVAEKRLQRIHGFRAGGKRGG